MARTEDLVKHAGVSRSTVFRFLRGENVRPAARQSILAAMQRLNIEPDGYGVHAGKTIIISIRPDFQSFKGYDLAVSGFMSRGEAQGFRLELRSGSAADAFGDQASGSDLAGVLFLGRTIPEEEAEATWLRSQGIPHVFVNRVFDDTTTSWVSVDHHRAAEDAVSYLFDNGFSEIGTWGHGSQYRVDREKRIGYLNAHQARGLEPPRSCVDYDTHGDLEKAVQDLIDQRLLPPAWFAASDEHAVRLIKVLRENGLSCPEDLAIIGMDDAGQAEFMNPSLTTIHIPFHDAGAAAFDVLKHLIENPGAASMRIVMKHHLVVRESCGIKRSPGHSKQTRKEEQQD